MSFPFPPELRMRRANPYLRGFVKSGGRNSTGDEQRVFSRAGRWEVDLGDIYIWDAVESRAYNAMLGRLRQGETMVFAFPPMPYRLNPPSPVTLTESASVGATALTVTMHDDAEGADFSIGDRMYRVLKAEPEALPEDATILAITGDEPWDDSMVWSPDEDLVLTVLPPLREAASAGAVCDYQNLRVTVKPDDMANGDPDLDRGFFGTVSLKLREAI